MPTQERKKIEQQQPKTLKWQGVGGFGDGQMYRIGVIGSAAIRRWMVGTFDEVLEMRRSHLNLMVRTEFVAFDVRETRSFAVRRPDGDGGLKWP